MFRHSKPIAAVPVVPTDKTAAVEIVRPEPTMKELRELVEKNLKWSQIIYEQNRKINNKLLWSAISDWLRILLIVVPLVLGIIYLEPLLKGVLAQYAGLLGNSSASTAGKQPNSTDSLFKLLNLDPAKQEQIKTLLK